MDSDIIIGLQAAHNLGQGFLEFVLLVNHFGYVRASDGLNGVRVSN